MTGPASRTAFSAVSDMEPDICDLKRISDLLRHVAEGSSYMDPGSLDPIAGLLHDMASRLHDQFTEAFQALAVRS